MVEKKIDQIRGSYGNPVAAFIIHPRSALILNDVVLFDISRHFPVWSPDLFGVTPENLATREGRLNLLRLYNTFMNGVPSGVVVGRFEGLETRGSRPVSSVLVGANMVPEVAFQAFPELVNFNRDMLYKDAVRRILDAIIFAREILGAKVIGLGAMTAS